MLAVWLIQRPLVWLQDLGSGLRRIHHNGATGSQQKSHHNRLHSVVQPVVMNSMEWLWTWPCLHAHRQLMISGTPSTWHRNAWNLRSFHIPLPCMQTHDKALPWPTRYEYMTATSWTIYVLPRVSWKIWIPSRMPWVVQDIMSVHLLWCSGCSVYIRWWGSCYSCAHQSSNLPSWQVVRHVAATLYLLFHLTACASPHSRPFCSLLYISFFINFALHTLSLKLHLSFNSSKACTAYLLLVILTYRCKKFLCWMNKAKQVHE